MERPLIAWATVLLRLALLLLAIGILPALAVQYVFTGFDALVPALLLFAVTPIGVIALVAAAILFLAGMARRPGGPS